MEAKGWMTILRGLKPTSLLDYWTIAAFLVAVLNLFHLRNADLEVLFFCLLPPSMALIAKDFSDRLSTRIVALLFLLSIGAGVPIASAERVLPELGGMDEGLASRNDRILAWYAVVYLAYVFGALPLFLFGRGLLDHLRKRKAQFSVFTCVLGLVASTFVAPLTFSLCVEHFGLYPPYK